MLGWSVFWAAAAAAFMLGGTFGVIILSLCVDGAWWVEFGKNLVTALALGIGIGAFTGSPRAGVLVFTIAINLKIGSKIADAAEEILRRRRRRQADGEGPGGATLF